MVIETKGQYILLQRGHSAKETLRSLMEVKESKVNMSGWKSDYNKDSPKPRPWSQTRLGLLVP